jgi:hypothetical protein
MTFDIFKIHAEVLGLMTDGAPLNRTAAGDFVARDGTVVRSRTVLIMERKGWVSLTGDTARITEAGRAFRHNRRTPVSRAA